MPDSFETRLRWCETYCHGNEAKSEERWDNQFRWNERMEEDMDALTKCVNTIKRDIAVDRVKLAGIFIVIQTVFTAVTVIVLTRILG